MIELLPCPYEGVWPSKGGDPGGARGLVGLSTPMKMDRHTFHIHGVHEITFHIHHSQHRATKMSTNTYRRREARLQRHSGINEPFGCRIHPDTKLRGMKRQSNNQSIQDQAAFNQEPTSLKEQRAHCIDLVRCSKFLH